MFSIFISNAGSGVGSGSNFNFNFIFTFNKRVINKTEAAKYRYHVKKLLDFTDKMFR